MHSSAASFRSSTNVSVVSYGEGFPGYVNGAISEQSSAVDQSWIQQPNSSLSFMTDVALACPKTRSVVDRCGAWNSTMQAYIDKYIRQLEDSLGRIREKIATANAAINSSNSEFSRQERLINKTPNQVFLPPYFKDLHGMEPPPNPDKLRKMNSGEFDPLAKPRRLWTRMECSKLRKAVKDALLEEKLVPYYSRKETMESKLASLKQEEENAMEFKSALELDLSKVEKELTKISKTTEKQLFESAKFDNVDWVGISGLDFNGDRTPEECRLKWKNELEPKWNQKPWSADEVRDLKQIVKNDGAGASWSTISNQLGTSRPSFACFMKYQNEINSSIRAKYWSRENDDFLREEMESCADFDSAPWDRIAIKVGKTKSQCQYRWKRCLDPGVKKGRWSDDEDTLLKYAVSTLGPQWAKISSSKLIPCRTQTQIRERWLQRIAQDWSVEDDKRLLEEVKKQGEDWYELALLFPNKSGPDVKSRYLSLIRRETLRKKPKMENISQETEGSSDQKGPRDLSNEAPKLHPRDKNFYRRKKMLTDLVGNNSAVPNLLENAPDRSGSESAISRQKAEEETIMSSILENDIRREIISQRKRKLRKDSGVVTRLLDFAAKNKGGKLKNHIKEEPAYKNLKDYLESKVMSEGESLFGSPKS